MRQRKAHAWLRGLFGVGWGGLADHVLQDTIISV